MIEIRDLEGFIFLIFGKEMKMQQLIVNSMPFFAIIFNLPVLGFAGNGLNFFS